MEGARRCYANLRILGKIKNIYNFRKQKDGECICDVDLSIGNSNDHHELASLSNTETFTVSVEGPAADSLGFYGRPGMLLLLHAKIIMSEEKGLDIYGNEVTFSIPKFYSKRICYVDELAE